MAITLNGTTGVTTTGLTSNGIDDNATSTAMTLDSSGNLLVGLSSQEAVGTNAGTQLRADGLVYAAATSDAHILSRRSSDGSILNFRKDTTPVGSIGTEGGKLYIDSSGGVEGKLKNQGSVSYLWHSNYFTSVNDNATDLGMSDLRYKDLYLSGGVYLGGTGAANKLDDYEEGTWTPTIAYSTTTGSITYGSRSGRYTKIGQVVYVSGVITTTASSGHSGELNITGLPYTVDTNLAGTSNSGSMIFRYVLGSARDGKFVGYFLEGDTRVVSITNKSDLTSPIDASTYGNSMSFRFDGWYITT